MALDGMMLSLVRKELCPRLEGARVEKVYQPSRDEVVLTLRGPGGAARLLLSARASGARVHLTEVPIENPAAPPMFCMLLRKHLGAARLTGLRQEGLDRILYLDFEGVNEFGDQAALTLACELMGRHSNLILMDGGGRILDALRRVDAEKSSVRQVLPGMQYTLPPTYDRVRLDEEPPERVLERVRAYPRDVELSKILGDVLEGACPLLAREIAYFATRGPERTRSQLGEAEFSRLGFYLGALGRMLQQGSGEPTLVQQPDGVPKEFSFVPVSQYGTAMVTRPYPTYSQLLDAFYARRDAAERMHQKSGDLLHLLANRSDRVRRRVQAQSQELSACADRERWRQWGDLLAANIHAFAKGDRQVTVADFYAEGTPDVSIPLDPLLTPSKNVQKYYNEYRKAATAEKMLTRLIEEGRQEEAYLDSVFDALTRASSEEELAAIRQELAQSGYARPAPGARGKKAASRLRPLRYRTSDGFTVWCGRNNLENEELTFRVARNYDLWFHIQKMPGSHVILVTDGRTPTDRAMTEAAMIAAYHSKGQGGVKLPVDYTRAKYVKKIPGAKPGLVLYDQFQTAIVDSDEQAVRALADP